MSPIGNKVKGDAVDAQFEARLSVVMKVDGDVVAGAGFGVEREAIGLSGLDGDAGLEELCLLGGINDLELLRLVAMGSIAGGVAGVGRG